ncbi:hypothetical protein [Streptococcus ferus]|uniref:hypothetical protein n=1 Tax=Streptococcus ferus TaxID=1345 RepID=UPI00359F6F67
MTEHLLKKAIKVKALSNYRIKVWYEDGKQVIYDVKPDIERLRAFNSLWNKEFFQEVHLSFGGRVIVWGDGFSAPDMDADVPYQYGEVA